jgi:hypothetical protein
MGAPGELLNRVAPDKAVILAAFPGFTTGPLQGAGMDDNKKGQEVLERAKSRKQTKPQTEEQSKFDGLHDFIKNYDGTGINWLPFITYGLGFMGEGDERLIKALRPVALKIMESAIFYGGGLKSGCKSGNYYESYPIEDLSQFIYELSRLLDRYETRVSGWPSETQEYFFSEAVRNLKVFMAGVYIFKGRRAEQPFKTALSNLKTIKKKVLAKPDITPQMSKSKLKKDVADIFRKHIQAPRTIIADRVSELLALFEIKTSPSAIAKKLPRKKHTP